MARAEVITEPATESPYAWLRLLVSLAMMTIGAAGMYAVAVPLPLVQHFFGGAGWRATCVGIGLFCLVSIHAAFLNGIAWNLLNTAIAGFLLLRASGGGAMRSAPG